MSGLSEKDPKEVAAAAAAETGKPDDSDVLMETEEERHVRIEKEEEGIKAALALIEASKDVAKFLTPDRAEKLSKQLGQRDDSQKDEEAKTKAKKEKERER
uniref:Uncharacterized protein n=1 Tax=Chromera velia CCMP2878 TaxID=1169474 RepID=A0A0G4I5E4_9ALVE|eukprot:Cvel_36086.t1-p1 / transcript=Cvel_36086.t1 / gene=Cvel_36086 / organism=Chromera_velia_CCMP2878 / gene_product=hypothetical protein / transcript_product=hypothetical protein / location=Cvel_scaffold6927:1690-2218(-) / protein_length=100 / sequence_SO=supercontig / SO=protein_coding / is_pseudo=false